MVTFSSASISSFRKQRRRVHRHLRRHRPRLPDPGVRVLVLQVPQPAGRRPAEQPRRRQGLHRPRQRPDQAGQQRPLRRPPPGQLQHRLPVSSPSAPTDQTKFLINNGWAKLHVYFIFIIYLFIYFLTRFQVCVEINGGKRRASSYHYGPQTRGIDLRFRCSIAKFSSAPGHPRVYVAQIFGPTGRTKKKEKKKISCCSVFKTRRSSSVPVLLICMYKKKKFLQQLERFWCREPVKFVQERGSTSDFFRRSYIVSCPSLNNHDILACFCTTCMWLTRDDQSAGSWHWWSADGAALLLLYPAINAVKETAMRKPRLNYWRIRSDNFFSKSIV